MAEEKKYEITISDLSAYIGAAAFEILPENAKEEDVINMLWLQLASRTEWPNIWTVPILYQRIMWLWQKRWDNLLMNLERFAKRLFKL